VCLRAYQYFPLYSTLCARHLSALYALPCRLRVVHTEAADKHLLFGRKSSRLRTQLAYTLSHPTFVARGSRLATSHILSKHATPIPTVCASATHAHGSRVPSMAVVVGVPQPRRRRRQRLTALRYRAATPDHRPRFHGRPATGFCSCGQRVAVQDASVRVPTDGTKLPLRRPLSVRTRRARSAHG
jgi:hypothetical protein